MNTAKAPVPQLHAGFSTPGADASSWADVVDALDRAEVFCISTVRADGRPHVTPLPAVWLDDALYFGTGLEEQKGRNLSRDSRCVLTTGSNSYRHGLDVVIEGRAEREYDRGTLEALAGMWQTRFDWPFDVDEDGFRHRRDGRAPNVDKGSVPVFAARPTKILAFRRGVEGFAQTRFTF